MAALAPRVKDIMATNPQAGSSNVEKPEIDTDSVGVLVVPVVTGVSPGSGPTTGGTVVTITGSAFIGATAVTFGGTSATIFNVNSNTQITATTPARPVGAAQVRVITPGGTSTNAVFFNYQTPPVPTVGSVSPSSGPTSGGTVVTITGTNFTGASAVTFGGTPATTFTVNSSTQITATTPVRPAGAAQVVVTAPGGTSNNTVAFFYLNAPALVGLTPDMGPTAGGEVVTITGTDLSGATAVTFGGTPATTFTVNSSTQITATTPARPAGAVQVVVTTPGGTSNSLSYAYLSAPTITSLVPAQGPQAGGNGVTINGSNLTFTSGITFGVNPASFVVLSDTQIAAVAPPGTGTVLVAVATPGGNSGTLPYNYIPAPQI
ncbi:IPT/TIG domain-containing protein [Saccharopolyspora sp. 5N708]|uniref:IPT/TIG domain-containing protein n=1 Tax=Saccharopolyspora sp. 5N708 TaxID=3457424 RepID=UPI003FD08538